MSHDISVVAIDDDSMLLRALDAELRDFGFNVKTFDDARKAIPWIKENRTDIVISDILMPHLNGFQVLEELKKIDANIDVIFVTAHGEMDTAIRALREGATDFFEKPFSSIALRAAIERTHRVHLLKLHKEILASEVLTLRTALRDRPSQRTLMVGRSQAMKKIVQDILDVAGSTTTVLITGESGTGKELVARGIHEASSRKDAPILTMNCPSIPEDLFESEIFGHRKGAFTGAVESREGFVSAAQGGTLFMDEIGDLPLRAQAKILRLLEQKVYQPVGEHRERPADVRIVAATNQPLEALVKERKFREDLFFRLNIFCIHVPALRERREDIPLLALFFTLKFASEMGKPLDGISDEAMRILMAYDFPGNVRELRNIIESTVIHCKTAGQIRPEDLPKAVSVVKPANTPQSATPSPEPWPLESLRIEDVERHLYVEALERTHNNVSAAARLIGLSRGKMRRRLAALGMDTDDASPDDL